MRMKDPCERCAKLFCNPEGCRERVEWLGSQKTLSVMHAERIAVRLQLRREHPGLLSEDVEMLRDMVISSLGGCCSICSFGDKRILQVDHVSKNGLDERLLLGDRSKLYYAYMIMKIAEGSKNYQLLCLNHHALKTIEENEKSEIGP